MILILGDLDRTSPLTAIGGGNTMITVTSSEASLSNFKALDVADAADEAESRDRSTSLSGGVITLDAGVACVGDYSHLFGRRP